jgi:hypothetical protein
MQRRAWYESYMAGYFDGEGMVRIESQGTVMAQIHSCYPCILRDAHKRFGGSIREFQNEHRPKWRPSYQWRICGNQALRFLASIYPFSREKKRQIQLALDFYQAGNTRRKAIRQQITKLKRKVHK